MRFIRYLFNLHRRIMPRLRGYLFSFVGQPKFRRRGVSNKIYGCQYINIGKDVCIGDFCWIEAVERYGDQSFAPIINLEEGVAISDLTHISAVYNVTIGANSLLGSKIYIGDHAHGSLGDIEELKQKSPGRRKLGGIAGISIGRNSWICDGVVILAGTQLHENSIVAANSVVKLITDKPALIAGNPAKIIKYLFE